MGMSPCRVSSLQQLVYAMPQHAMTNRREQSSFTVVSVVYPVVRFIGTMQGLGQGQFAGQRMKYCILLISLECQ